MRVSLSFLLLFLLNFWTVSGYLGDQNHPARCTFCRRRGDFAPIHSRPKTLVNGTKMSVSGRIQVSLLQTFWGLATRMGMRRLGAFLKQMYPSAYGDSIFYFETAKNYVALTIDDGIYRQDVGGASMIQEVCDLLRSYQARATFFVCTNYTTKDQVEQIIKDGHEVGNHLKEDKSGYYCNLQEEDFARELDETNEILRAFVANDTQQIKWFRAPQGVMSRAMCEVLRDRQMKNVLGDCYCDDWAFAEKVCSTSQVVAPIMLKQAEAGSIAIFHMPQRGFRETTLDALEEFLHGLKERNLKSVTISEMMDLQQNQL